MPVYILLSRVIGICRVYSMGKTNTAKLYGIASVKMFIVLVSNFFSSFSQHSARQFKTKMSLA